MEKKLEGKYVFHEDLKPYENQKVLLNPRAVSILQKMMEALYLKERDDENVHVSTEWISVSEEKKVRVLIYEPKNSSGKLPCMYFIHGGGFVFNAAPHHFWLARRFTKELQVKTIFVDYHLAPKYQFPVVPEECFGVYQWISEHADELSIQSDKIMVCGDSAGGNLATVVCMMARDYGIQLPKLQMLLYPVVDRRMCTESYKQYVDTPMCNSRDMEKYFQMYVNAEEKIKESEIPYLSPLEAASLENMPEAYVEVAEYDCLHDEGVEYAKALEKAGVPAVLRKVPDTMHGYDIAKNSAFMEGIMKERVDFIKKHLMGSC